MYLLFILAVTVIARAFVHRLREKADSLIPTFDFGSIGYPVRDLRAVDIGSGAFYEATALLINVVRNVRAEFSSNSGVTATVSAAVVSL